MNGLKATLVMIFALFVLSLLCGSNVTLCPSAGTGVGETPNRMVFLSDVTTPPDLDHPADFTYELGATGNTISWTFGDAYPGDYRVDGNGSTLGWTSWATNGTYPLNVDGLALGVHNHTITVRDSYLNEAKDTVFVTVRDTTPPSWVQAPIDQTVELGAAFRYDLNATDLSGVSGWWINNTVNFQIDTNGVITNKTGLSVNVYGLRVNATDGKGNVLSGTFRVTVRDTTPPAWTQVPVNQTVELGSSFRYDINATDLSGVPTWWVNDTTNFQIDGSGVVTNIMSLAIGPHPVRVNATDGQGNVLSGTFTVTVQDTTSPTWDQTPVDQTFEAGSPFRYDLNASDLSEISSWWVNDTTRFSIDSNGVMTNITPLSAGVYGVQVIVTDNELNTLIAEFSVTVLVSTPPDWVQTPADRIVEFGGSFRYDLNATDFSGIGGWWINDTVNFQIDSAGVITNKIALVVHVYGLRVNVSDTLGNIRSATFRVTVQDTTPPVWAPAPVNQIVELGSSFRYDINATDLSGVPTWWVNDTTNFQIDAGGVVTNKIALIVGTYGLRVNATDGQGNLLSGTFKVTVRDTTPPVWAPAPVNQIVEFGSSFRYDLNATDLSGVSIWWVNNTVNFQIDINGVITNKTGLPVGTYGLRVNATDGQGNVLTGTFRVTIRDTTPPTWAPAPTNQTVELGTSFRYDLNATDPSGVSSWWVNDTTHFQIDTSGVVTNKTALSVGAYGLRVNATDGQGNVLTGTFRVTVRDTTPPVWAPTPVNQIVEFGSSFRYDLNATDLSGVSIWWVNDTTDFQIDASGVVTNRIALAVSIYGLRVNATDGQGNVVTGTFRVTVRDTTPPVWAPAPVNQIVEFGSTFRYDLNATDLSGVTIWWANDTTHFQIDTSGVVTNKTALSVGVYGLRVNATDGQGNVLTGTFRVTVQDSTLPTWSPAPTDQTVEFGSTFRYDLNATDLSGVSVWWVNDTIHFQIDITGVVTNKTTLSVSIYGLRVNATDGQGNILSGTFRVTVRDTTPPVWGPSPVNQNVEFGTSFRYDLNATDLSGVPVWWVNDTTNFQIDGTGVITNKIALSVIVYGLRVNATDGQGNVLSGTFRVTVQDTTPPVWGPSPVNQNVEFGTSFRYDLNATDLSGVPVWWINDTTNFQIDGTGVITNKIALSVRIYDLRVNATDGQGNVLSRTFSVTVQDTTAPVWVQAPEDQELDFRALFRYDLNASDLSGIAGWWVNDTSDFQVDSSGVITNITPLTVRFYGLRVNVTDTQGNTLSATFRINSWDTTFPTWDHVPTDKTIERGARFRYDLNASDLTGIDSWAINDTVDFQIDGNGIITNSTSLVAGDYPLLVTVTNNVGNNITAIFTVTVQPSNPPSWDQTPTDQIVEFGNAFRYDLNATDFSGIGVWWVNDTTNFAIDGTGVITNAVLLTIRVYSLRVNVSDTLGYTQTATITVTVQDTTTPVWDQVPVGQVVEFGSSFRYDLNATDLSGIAGWWVNDSINFQVDMNGVVTNNIPLAVGYYGVRVNATDDEGNTLSGVFAVTVQDTTSPTWDQIPSNQRVGLNQQFVYDLDATDLSGIASWVVNDTARFTFVWAGLLQNATPLPTGVYWIEVKACDPYNNNVTAVISVMVDDGSVPTWDQVPSDQAVEFGAQFRLDLNASDPSGISYYWVNDTARFSMYPNGTVVSTVSLSVGTYWLEVRAYDPYDLYITATISIAVDDTTAPTWTQPVTDRYVEFGNSLRYDINASDLSGIGGWWINDTTRFSIDVNGVITNVTALQVGRYGIMVNVTDTYANVGSISFAVEVQDSTAPTWVQTPTGQTLELGAFFRYDVNATDLSGIASYWVNDTVHFTIDGQGVLSNATTLSLGVYWLQIRALDQYDNALSIDITVTVVAATTTTTVSPNIIDFIMTMLTNVYVLAGIAAIVIVAAAAKKRKKGGKTYEVRDLGAKFGSKK